MWVVGEVWTVAHEGVAGVGEMSGRPGVEKGTKVVCGGTARRDVA